MVPSSVAEFRARYRSSELSRFYRGWLHFSFTTFTSLAIVVYSLSGVRDAGWAWLAVPLTFLFANFAEYNGHRRAMHVPRRFVRVVYTRHTIQHHHYFVRDAMEYENSRDFKMVLFPPVLILFFFGLFALPVGTALWILGNPNIARLFVATAVGYFLFYEWLHFYYHLPESWLTRLPILSQMRRHHSLHHDLALMGKWNFNLTLPICDRLFGTHYRED